MRKTTLYSTLLSVQLYCYIGHTFPFLHVPESDHFFRPESSCGQLAFTAATNKTATNIPVANLIFPEVINELSLDTVRNPTSSTVK